ncbi:MAG: phage portal protein, partial [Phycisphaerae bacterium]|nr:phage portal protein [Phycisphaerae bacterium]
MSALLVLKDVFTEHGFSFEQTTTGFEVPCRSASLAEEYQRLRQGIAFTELGDVLVYHVTGENASDYLDYIAAGDVIRLREEHILHTVC